jgi:hypothetical protein
VIRAIRIVRVTRHRSTLSAPRGFLAVGAALTNHHRASRLESVLNSLTHARRPDTPPRATASAGAGRHANSLARPGLCRVVPRCADLEPNSQGCRHPMRARRIRRTLSDRRERLAGRSERLSAWRQRKVIRQVVFRLRAGRPGGSLDVTQKLYQFRHGRIGTRSGAPAPAAGKPAVESEDSGTRARMRAECCTESATELPS